jgi:prepilin-type N-terminal cleavage/methylation domain-containing protein
MHDTLNHPATVNQAFSLVELSIVLVILGLLIGGILSGQSLIRAAELRSVSTEYSRWVTSTQTFRDKYFALPGDMNNATQFWLRQVNAAHCATNSAASVAATGVCDGNGDGVIVSMAPAASQSSEGVQAWRQLAAAGLIEGSYSGLVGSAYLNHATRGGNSPASKVNRAMWSQGFWNNLTGGNPIVYAIDFGNVLIFGGEHATDLSWVPVLTPEEAWNIDTKVDDGKPARGTVIAVYWDGLCAQADDGSNADDDFNASYRLIDRTQQCALMFKKAF